MQNISGHTLKTLVPPFPGAIIKGQVTASTGDAAAYVTVGVAGTGEDVITGPDGEYRLKVKPGMLTIGVSAVGFVSRTKKISVAPGQEVTVNFILTDTVNHLKAVTISYSRNQFATHSSNDVARMPLPNLQNPQVYITIPQNLTTEQMAVSYTDAFKNIAGSEIPSVANNGRVDISSRGFKVRSQVVDGVSGYTMTAIDPANIEKIEVIKGPSATLFGSSLTSYGGLVNIVTKQPYDHPGGGLSYTHGGAGLNRLTLDANTPLNKNHTLLFRVNGAGELHGSYLDAGFAKSIFVAPVLSYRINDRLTVRVNAEYYGRKATSPFWFTPFAKTTLRDPRDLSMDYHLSFSNKDVYYTARQLNGRVRADFAISDTWKSTTVLGRTFSGLDGLMLSLRGVSDSTLTRSVSAGPQHFSTLEFQQNFLHERTIGHFTNRLLLGLDFYHYASDASVADIKIDTADFIHPGSHYADFDRAIIMDRLTGNDYKKTSANQNTYSAYASDVVSLKKRWFAMLSLRVDRFQDQGTPNASTGKTQGRYGQTTLSPKIGLIYQPVPEQVSVFANLMNGFENVNGTDFQGNSFKPQQAGQLEVGVKLALLKGRLMGTASIYQIRVKDILRDDPDHQHYEVQNGTELSRGIEVNTSANPFPGLNILAGYAYNFCEYQKADDGMSGRRPDGAGPQHTAHIWISHHFQKGSLKGLGVGGGENYGGRLQTIKSFAAEFNVPAYSILDATVFYEHRFYRVGVKLNNLTDERYWNNRLQLQPPRSLAANITLAF